LNIHFRRKQVCFKEKLIRVSEGNYSIMVTGGNDSLVKVWKLWNKGKKSAQMEKMKILSGHGESIMSVKFAQNGRIFVSTSGDKTLRIWHASNLVCLRVIEGHGRYV
jgi:WD40 repeat protein